MSIKYEVGLKRANIDVPIPHLGYLDAFVKQNGIGEDIMKLGVFPNAKEVTESYAAYNAVWNKLGISHELLKRINPLIIVAGDGASPRTGVLMAFKTPFAVVSIDPNANGKSYSSVKRLSVIKNTLGSTMNTGYSSTPVVLVSVHGHIPANDLEIFRSAYSDIVAVVEIPCCMPREFSSVFGEPDIAYEDWGIHSPHRLVRIWKEISS